MTSPIRIVPALLLLAGCNSGDDDDAAPAPRTNRTTPTPGPGAGLSFETPTPVAIPQGAIALRIDGLRMRDMVCYSLVPESQAELFANPAAPADRLTAAGCQTMTQADQPVLIKDVPPGRYALAVFLDVDQNETLTTLEFTDETDNRTYLVPYEPIGFSNGRRITPPPRLHVPTFAECAFTHGEATTEMEITLQDPSA